MKHDSGTKAAFINRRDWVSYLSALQSAATYPKVLDTVYPKVLDAVNSGCAWFTEGATHASSWLVGRGELTDKFSTG